MVAIQSLRRSLKDEQFRGVILLGVASIPFTVGVNWMSTSDPVSGVPVFVASVISGYVYKSRSMKGRRAGAVTGLVGGVPILLWQTVAALAEWWGHPILVEAVGESWIMALASVGAAGVTFVVLAIVLSTVGAIGGFIGGFVNSALGTISPLGSRT